MKTEMLGGEEEGGGKEDGWEHLGQNGPRRKQELGTSQ